MNSRLKLTIMPIYMSICKIYVNIINSLEILNNLEFLGIDI